LISVTVSNQNPRPDEIVTITGAATPIEDILIDVYNAETGERIAIFTIYIKTLNNNVRRTIPGIWRAVVQTWAFHGKDSGETAPSITVTIQHDVPPDITLALSASKTVVEPSEIVTFQVTTTPVATYTITLEACVSGIRTGIWRVPVVGGVGEDRLVPGQVGDVVEWRVFDDYGNVSNWVTTTVSEQPPVGEPKASIIGIRAQDMVRFLWYEVYPEEVQAYCVPGEKKLHVVFGAKNVGGADGELRGKLTDDTGAVIIPELARWCNVGNFVYWESDITMPPSDYGLMVEVGTESLEVGYHFIVKTTMVEGEKEIPLWKPAAVVLGIVGVGAAGYAVARRKAVK